MKIRLGGLLLLGAAVLTLSARVQGVEFLTLKPR